VELYFLAGLESLLRKDSLGIDDDDRAIIRWVCEEAAETRTLIPHGAETLCQTADWLMENEKPQPFFGKIASKKTLAVSALPPFVGWLPSGMKSLFALPAATSRSQASPTGMTATLPAFAAASR
jgi:hypothetical protein